LPLKIPIPNSEKEMSLITWAKGVVTVSQGLELIKDSKKKVPIIV
jgi:hypothetical protein